MIKYLLILCSITSYIFATQENYYKTEHTDPPAVERIFYNHNTADGEYDNLDDPYDAVELHSLNPEVSENYDSFSYAVPYEDSYIPEGAYHSPSISITEDDFYDQLLQDYYESVDIVDHTTEIYQNIKQDYRKNPNISQIVGNIYTELPKKEQDLIRLVILDYELEKQKNQLYFLPAVNNVLAQKNLLSCELNNTMKQKASSIDQIRVKSLIKVILEKEFMISNLMIFQENTDKTLYQNLKKEISVIIKEWLYNELIKPSHTQSELLQTINMIFNIDN